MSITVTGGGFTITSGSYADINRDVYDAPTGLIVADYVSNSNFYIQWDFGDIAIHPTQLHWQQSAALAYGSWNFEGSNDGVTWETLNAAVSLGQPSYDNYYTVANHAKHFRYMRIFGIGGSKTGSSNVIRLGYWRYDTSRDISVTPGDGGIDPGGDGSGGGANDPGGINDPSTHAGFEMSDLAVYAGDLFLGWFKGTDMPSAPAAMYVALFDKDPNDVSAVELTNDNNITRQEITFGSIVSRFMLNTNTLAFGSPDIDIEVGGFALYNAASAGDRCTAREIDPPVSFIADAPVVIRPGKLPVYY